KTDLEIYLPDFLPLKDQIKTKTEITEICSYANLWYDFYERSLIWRYGKLPEEWVEGKENVLNQ
ncbi:hypothetical protein, partial [Lentibacillus jeotgali]|uniref:hypothetical protein n=1 Tax=Lentibacillus jeotgali TaxID=558169 RepID=UPI0002627447